MYVTCTSESQCVFRLCKFKSVKEKKQHVVLFFFPQHFLSFHWKVRRRLQLEEIHGGKVGVKSRQWRKKNEPSCFLATCDLCESCPGDAGKVSHSVGCGVRWMRFNYAAHSKQVATPQVASITQRRLEERASVSCLAASAICSGEVWIWLCSHS